MKADTIKRIVEDHGHKVEIVGEKSVKIIDACCLGKEWFDEVVTVDSGCFVETFNKSGRREYTESFTNLKSYLGY